MDMESIKSMNTRIGYALHVDDLSVNCIAVLASGTYKAKRHIAQDADRKLTGACRRQMKKDVMKNARKEREKNT